jgi:hypothetical protein
MQKAGFCISRRIFKCYASRFNFAPPPWQSRIFRSKEDALLSNRSFGKEFLNQQTKK